MDEEWERLEKLKTQREKGWNEMTESLAKTQEDRRKLEQDIKDFDEEKRNVRR